MNSLTLEAVAGNLEAFALTLNEKERTALSALLQSAAAVNAKSEAAAAALTAQVFGPGAALLALEQCGAAALLADGPISARTVAAQCRVEERRVRRMLEALSAAGLVGRQHDRYSLPECLAVVYGNARRRGMSARPIWEATALWSHLSTWAKTGEPYLRMDDVDGSAYSRVVSTLAHINRDLARRLAIELRKAGDIPPGAAILDVGAGTAVWSIALVCRDRAAIVTALDRESVLVSAKEFAAEAGMAEQMYTIAGDWRDAPLEHNAYDVIMLANICHLESPGNVALMLQRMKSALRPNGILVIVDTIPERRETAPASVLLHGLRLGLRSSNGDIYDLAQYRWCVRVSGLRCVRTITLADEDANVRAIVVSHRGARTTLPTSEPSSPRPQPSSKRDRPPGLVQSSQSGKTNRRRR